jgi:hypothetical protein
VFGRLITTGEPTKLRRSNGRTIQGGARWGPT